MNFLRKTYSAFDVVSWCFQEIWDIMGYYQKDLSQMYHREFLTKLQKVGFTSINQQSFHTFISIFSPCMSCSHINYTVFKVCNFPLVVPQSIEKGQISLESLISFYIRKNPSRKPTYSLKQLSKTWWAKWNFFNLIIIQQWAKSSLFTATC